jgi:hypothetical protein
MQENIEKKDGELKVFQDVSFDIFLAMV